MAFRARDLPAVQGSGFLVPPIDGTLRGHAVADVIHLLAELVENAHAPRRRTPRPA